MGYMHEAGFGPVGVGLEVLEPIFEGMPPLRYNVDLVRAVVWATDEMRAARIIRISPLRFAKGESEVLEPEEMNRPLTYNASVGLPHRLGGLMVFSASWIAGPEESAAHYLENRDFFQYYSPDDADTLTSPEDIFEVYDKNMRTNMLGYTATIGRKGYISPNIFSADGMKVLAVTAPRQ
jgi:hypothetical protein